MAGINVHTFTDSNFEADVLGASLPVLVDFAATWCGPCKALAPTIERIADEFAGKVIVGKLDIDDAQAIARKYNVRSVPTLIVFRGGQPSGTLVGLTTRDKIVKFLGL